MSNKIVLQGEATLIQKLDGEVELSLITDGEVGTFMPILPVMQENKTATPTERAQVVTPDPQYNGLRRVSISAIPSDYVGSAVIHDPTITVTGRSVNVPKGYYTEDTTASVQGAEQATPSISINGGDITATSVQSEGYVQAGTRQATASIPTVEQATPSLSVSSGGLITAVSTQAGGYVTAGTKTATSQLSTQAGATIAPTESQQTAVASGKYTTGVVKVGAIPSNYVGSTITRDPTPTASGATVNIPTGYYSTNTSKTVQTVAQATPSIAVNANNITASVTQGEGYVSGGTKTATATVPSGDVSVDNKSITANPSISIDNNGEITATVSGTASLTATVNDGYVDGYTAGTATVSGSSTSQLPTMAGQTVTPSTSSQSLATQGKYMTGDVTINAIPTGTAGTPTATKGAVSNHSVTVTPSVTNTTGYITGSTITGTGVSVSASELVSGTLSVTNNGTADVTNYANIDVNVSGGGGLPPKVGVIRGDAELVQKWTYDKMMTADLSVSLPAYNSSSQTTLIATTELATYDGTPLTYRYLVVQRTLLIPVYSIATVAKGREDHVYSSCVHEWVYQPANQIQTLDGSKTYGQYSQMVANGPNSRMVYWSSATAITPYTSTSYGLALTMQAPTIATNKTITIKSPTLTVRGHATYFSQTYWEAVTDARMQYVIELWRVPIEQGVINGWTHTSQYDSIDNDVNNNNGKLR